MSTSTILIVDDHPDLLDRISLTLQVEGYQTLTAEDGSTAVEILGSHKVDLILADIAMPGMNGYQLYERVRENPEWITTPFIFLTARGMDSDIRYAKEMGIDDYLTKPIEPEDLIAAIRGRLQRAAQLRMAAPDATITPVSPAEIVHGRLRIELGQYRAWLEDEQLQLSATEFKLLEHLALNADQLVTPQDLIQITHDYHTDYSEASDLLRPLVRTLRRKLGYDTGDPGCIENVRGVGYRMTAP